jgi:hypothetical protein
MRAWGRRGGRGRRHAPTSRESTGIPVARNVSATVPAAPS